LTGDRSQDSFAAGLTEELTAQLGRSCRDIVSIVARWSTQAVMVGARGTAEAGEALQADYVLEGGTRREGPRVRVTARLVDTASGVHRWSDTYDRTMSDSLFVQTDIAGAVAHALARELTADVRHIACSNGEPHALSCANDIAR
jgi:TolB-like protein